MQQQKQSKGGKQTKKNNNKANARSSSNASAYSNPPSPTSDASITQTTAPMPLVTWASPLLASLTTSFYAILGKGMQNGNVFGDIVLGMLYRAHDFAFKSMTSFNVICTFMFPFAFRFTMKMMYWGMPQWAPVCLWYSYLVHVFYGNSDYMGLPVSLLLWVLRVLTPVMFLMEGVSEKRDSWEELRELRAVG